MTKQDAKRVVCGVAAQLIEGNLFMDLSEADDLRIREAIDELYAELMRRSGLAEPRFAPEDVLEAVLKLKG